MNTSIKTLGELKSAGYQSKDIKTELRDNLISSLREGKKTFQGMHGYEQTVIPQLERAILSKHNINLLLNGLHEWREVERTNQYYTLNQNKV